MRTIIRCPSCFTYVYADARACHGCGERLGKRKILRRGSWVFIALAVTGFTIARGIDLEQERQWQSRREAQRQEQIYSARIFVSAWLRGDAEIPAIPDSEQFRRDLAKLRDRYPTVLPVTKVVGDVQVTESDEQAHYHQSDNDSPVSHERWGNPDATASRRASYIPPQRLVGEFRTRVNGVKIRYTSWYQKSYEVEVEFTKDDKHYTFFGEVCIDEKVSCLTISKIVGVEEGVVKPAN